MAQQNGTTGLRSIIITEWLLRSVSVQGGGTVYFIFFRLHTFTCPPRPLEIGQTNTNVSAKEEWSNGEQQYLVLPYRN